MPVNILLQSAKKRSDRNSLTMSLMIDCGNGDTPIEELKIVHVHGRGFPTKMNKSYKVSFPYRPMGTPILLISFLNDWAYEER
jgi:hypothetical protein